MTALALRRTPEAPAGTTSTQQGKRLVIIVGYDGSAPARHALDQAADLLKCRDGLLEVVYVPQLPIGATLSGVALAEVRRGFDDQAAALAEDVRLRLVGQGTPWHFQRRDGRVTSELLAVATDLHHRYDDTAEIVIVVGGSAHRYHHLIGSVSSSVARPRRFPVMMVP